MLTARIITGDALDGLASMPDRSVHCCVTSPPYFGLRDYGVVGQLGLEPTLEAYIETMVGVFREVRRVLRDDGTLWLNLGDSYAGSGKGAWDTSPERKSAVKETYVPTRAQSPLSGQLFGLKPKDLMMVPARLALALQADGWWLRSEIVWAKKAPMPESVTDRPTSSHEKIFLLTKAERYYYDAEAVREKAVRERPSGNGYKRPEQISKDGRGSDEPWQPSCGRNLRNVWHLGPEPFPEAHFATFPTEIPRRAILAGTSERGVCLSCGAPFVRQLKRERTLDGVPAALPAMRNVDKATPNSAQGVGHWRTWTAVTELGWAPTCSCGAGDTIGRAVVLDPFNGAGTTGVVAGRLGRDYIGIELNPEYALMSERRITREVGPLLVKVTA